MLFVGVIMQWPPVGTQIISVLDYEESQEGKGRKKLYLDQQMTNLGGLAEGTEPSA